MSGNFKVGEVLVGVGFVSNPECNGQECVVIEGLHISEVRDWVTHLLGPAIPVYRVRWRDNCECLVSPYNLRRKQPPSGEQSILRMFTQPMPSKEIA